ncbi:MAG: N-acetylmuramoyl-L-alanine amidase [bacterium]
MYSPSSKKSPDNLFLYAFFCQCLALLLLYGACRPVVAFSDDRIIEEELLLPEENQKTYCLVIDPGHGDKDNGSTLGANLLEKDLTLDIARKIKKLALADTGINVVLTRSGDDDVPLENRAALANHLKADFFLSIHFSNHLYPAQDALWIITAVYPPEEVEFSSMTNGSWKSMQSRHLIESREFAQRIAKAARTNETFQSVNMLEAPVYVLEGASMAAIEVELGFSATKEAIEKMESDNYRLQVAKDLFQGILDYIKEQEEKS